MTLWWAIGLILLGVALDRWVPRAMHQAAEEDRVQQLRQFGAAPSNVRVLQRPELYDQEADDG